MLVTLLIVTKRVMQQIREQFVTILRRVEADIDFIFLLRFFNEP